MTLRVLIIPDKFKGTLTASAAASAIARGWRRARPDDHLTLLPMSDGGDGFGGISGQWLGARHRTIATVNAAHQPVSVRWWFEPRTRTAIVESANVIGLAMLPPGKHHPFELDTFGLGAVLKAAARAGARRCLVGVGGSATNDGGFGMARALGWSFLDSRDQPIRQWTDLARLVCLLPPARSPLGRMRITVATDVQNLLLGKHGASRVYGPQKGLQTTDLGVADACFRTLSRVVRRHLKRSHALTPGAGAAGGLGFGLFAFTNADAKSGFELFSHHADLKKRLRSTDLVITGEGCIDRSTLMGKGVGDVARRCQESGIPCIGLSGVLGDERQVRRLFADVESLAPDLTTNEQARARPDYWLSKLAEHVSKRWSARSG